MSVISYQANNGHFASHPVRPAMPFSSWLNNSIIFSFAYPFFTYSVLRAVTGSLFAALLEGINPPIKVKITLSRISITA